MLEKSEVFRCHCLRLFLLLLLVSELPKISTYRSSPRPRCPEPNPIANGRYRLRQNNMVMRVSCRPGFELQGSTVFECVRGKWSGRKPVCAKSGCTINTANPEHGVIQMEGDYRMILFCLDNYNLAGNRVAYCNGTHWDREIGNCREPSYNIEHDCDFETEDLCGWEVEESRGTEWRRVMAANIYTSYHTGPRQDHTLMSSTGGYYMLMETVHSQADPSILLSPIYERDLSLKTACCFQFYYFMFGSGVGELSIYVRPVSLDMKKVISHKDDYQRFTKSGNQNNSWNKGNFTIPEMDEDFQIMIVATAGKSHLSDIAIDDVRLMIGDDCKIMQKGSEEDDETSLDSDETTEGSLFDMESCAGRCFSMSGFGYIRRSGFLFGQCNCDFTCFIDETCCPDFEDTCLVSAFSKSVDTATDADATTQQDVNLIPNTTTTTTTRMPTTTRKTTTTTTTTTPRTTTTTTTPKPKPKPTKATTTTTTTTTTTRKPTTVTTPKPKTTSTPIPTKKTTIAKKIITPTSTTTKTTPTSTTSTTTTTTIKIIKPKFQDATTKTIKPALRTTTQAVMTKSNPQKKELNAWRVDNSSQEYHSSAGRILLTVLVLAGVFIGLSVAVYRYKHGAGNWCSQLIRGDGNDNGNGSVETTSIRAKFLKKPHAFNAVNVVSGIKNRLGRNGGAPSDDITGLIEYENDHDIEARFGLDNPTSSSNSSHSSSGNIASQKTGVSTIL